jgi:hypothetical protein
LEEPLTCWRRHSQSQTLSAYWSRNRLLKLTWQRIALFNRLAGATGQPKLSAWRNRRLYLQLARFLMPWPGAMVARWRLWHRTHQPQDAKKKLPLAPTAAGTKPDPAAE